jgi:hypothetical protein
LYYAIDYQVFTDAILHQVQLEEDAIIAGRGEGWRAPRLAAEDAARRMGFLAAA